MSRGDIVTAKTIGNVTFLNGKSVSRVKSVFQEVKRFSMNERNLGTETFQIISGKKKLA